MTDLDPSATSKSSSPQWHLHIPPETYGPYSLQQLRDYAGEGRMNADTLVWSEGSEGWGRAGDQAALKPLFAGLAPAAPPSPPAPQAAAQRPAASSYVLGASGAVPTSAAVATSVATIGETSVAIVGAPAGGGTGFGDAVRTCLQQKYLGFSGRAARSEFWWFMLFLTIVSIVVYGIAGWLAYATSTDSSMSILGVVVLSVAALVELALAPPAIAAAVRRLHDLGWSGWWYLAQLIPFVGGIVALVMLIGFMMRGTVGSNTYGPDPLGGV